MWIVPRNLEISHFALEVEDLKKELSEPELRLTRSLMWRSKLFKFGTWSRRWKRVYWLRDLFGRILKPSTHHHFVTEYTSLLLVIRANHIALPEQEKEQKTQGTFGRIFGTLSKQLDLFSASSKTSLDTYQKDSKRYLEAYNIWVTQLRQEYSRRLKWALHIIEKDYSSLHVPTLENSGDVWPTPTTRDWKDGTAESCKNVPSNMLLGQEVHKYGQLAPDKPNTTGKSRAQLNPAWVAQLMGTTFGQSFFANLATE